MSIKVTHVESLVSPAVLARMAPGLVQGVIADTMESARAWWIQQAGNKLHSSRRDYINGIQPLEVWDGGAALTLLGVLPNMIENGAPAFDMHDTLLGPNVPVVPVGQRGKHINAKGQFWRVVPFRHQVPGTIGQGGGAVMGSAYVKMLGVGGAALLGQAVHAAAKKLTASKGMPGGGVQYGKRLPAGVGGAPLLKPIHSTDIYAGMIKQSKTYKAATQSTYATFRIISEARPEKWLHPGIQPAQLLTSVAQHVETVLPKALLAAVHAAITGAP